MLKTPQKVKSSKRIPVQQYNKEIEEAVERVKNGKFVSNEEAMKQLDFLTNS